MNFQIIDPMTITNSNQLGSQVTGYQGQDYFNLSWAGTGTGVFQVDHMAANRLSASNWAGPIGTVNVTNYNTITNTWEGSYGATLADSTSGGTTVYHRVTGTFKAIR